MKTTIDLLNRVKGPDSDDALAARLGIGRTAIVMARKAGRVSPDLAARLAELVDDDPVRWIAIAAVEQMNDGQRARWLPRVAALFVLAAIGASLTVAADSAEAKSLNRIQIMRSRKKYLRTITGIAASIRCAERSSPQTPRRLGPPLAC